MKLKITKDAKVAAIINGETVLINITKDSTFKMQKDCGEFYISELNNKYPIILPHSITKKYYDLQENQLTLGELLAYLENQSQDTTIRFGHGFLGPHSYRGYYDHVAFEQTDGEMTVEDVCGEVIDAIGKTYVGWKGGTFAMNKDTPVWIAEVGCCGIPITKEYLDNIVKDTK